MSDATYALLSSLFAVVGETMAQWDGLVIDGGTQSGVMQLMGEALAHADQPTPHIGVVPIHAEAGPHGAQAEDILEPHHSNFVLVDSDKWGGEVEMMYRLADYLSANIPSIAILINGGDVSLLEVEKNIQQGREIIVIAGSGRLADTIAEAIHHPERSAPERIKAIIRNGRLTLFDIMAPPEELAQILRQRLH